MRITLSRDGWFQCIVALSKADALPEVADAIRDKLAESSAPMDAEMAIVLSPENAGAIGRCVGGRIEESLIRQAALT